MVKKKPVRRFRGSNLGQGVHTGEVSSGPRPIEGVGTAVAAFVGFVRRRPLRGMLAGLAVLAVVLVVVRARRD